MLILVIGFIILVFRFTFILKLFSCCKISNHLVSAAVPTSISKEFNLSILLLGHTDYNNFAVASSGWRLNFIVSVCWIVKIQVKFDLIQA